MMLLFAAAAIAALFLGLFAFTGSIARKVTKALPPIGQFMDAGGARLHYRDQGSGPAILLIHGLGGQMQHFTYALADLLATRHRIIIFDRPGSGYSQPRPANADSLIAQAAILAKAIAKLGLPNPPLLVGHSMGGAISLAIALNHPEAASGLVLIAPLTHQMRDPPKPFKSLAIRSKLVRFVVAWTFAAPLSILRGQKLLKAVFAPEQPPSDFPLRGGGLLGLRPRAFQTASADMVAANNSLAEMIPSYRTLTIPLGILYGDKDEILDYKDHALPMKKYVPHVEIKLLNERGHMLPITAPQETAGFIFDRHAAASAGQGD
jgi:pimeloyl-ACP methyl ester carboxylesterase